MFAVKNKRTEIDRFHVGSNKDGDGNNDGHEMRGMIGCAQVSEQQRGRPEEIWRRPPGGGGFFFKEYLAQNVAKIPQ